MEFYVMVRNEEYSIVSVTKEGDPLYGNGSWNIAAGPFESWDEANKWIDEQ